MKMGRGEKQMVKLRIRCEEELLVGKVPSSLLCVLRCLMSVKRSR